MSAEILLLDSTVLVAYERELTRRAQAVVLEAMTDGRLLAAPALSLALAAAQLAGETRELAWLVYDPAGPVSVLPLALNALEVGGAAAAVDKVGDLEVAQVVYEARATSAVVLTYEPARYTGATGVDVVDMRP